MELGFLEGKRAEEKLRRLSLTCLASIRAICDGSAFEDVPAGQLLKAVHFVPGFFGVPAEFGGHEGADAGGGGHA